MAEGNCFGEMPSFDSSASSEAKKRHFSSDGSESLFGLYLKVSEVFVIYASNYFTNY